MKAIIRDDKALSVVSPMALAAYARAMGWSKMEPYGDHSDVYAAEGLPEIILPRTRFLGDYTRVVSQLIGIFAEVTQDDEIALYRNLVMADRDVVRVRAIGDDDGAVSVDNGIDLIRGSRGMLLAAACSLTDPRPIYHRAGTNKEAGDYLNRVRLGQTEQGSFVVTLLTPALAPPTQLPLDPKWDDDPIERRISKRLVQALTATRDATEKTVGGVANAFPDAVKHGISANLCEAIVQLVKPFPALDIKVAWALTRPTTDYSQEVRFSQNDTPILSDAARLFRSREPKPDERLFGFVQRLKRDESEADGTITLRASIDGRTGSVTAILNAYDYERAIQAHKDKAPVIAEGDLERAGQSWRLLNPRITEVIQDDDSDGD